LQPELYFIILSMYITLFPPLHEHLQFKEEKKEMKENEQAYMYNTFKLTYGKENGENKQRKKIPCSL